MVHFKASSIVFLPTVLLLGDVSAKRPAKGIHTAPCKPVEVFPRYPIGHPLDLLPDAPSDPLRHHYVLDRISDPSTFDPNVRFSATITENDHKLNLNYSITALNKKAVKKTFYFRTIFEIQKKKYVDFSHYLFHFESCEIDVNMVWDKARPPIVELFEFRDGKPTKEIKAGKGL